MRPLLGGHVQVYWWWDLNNKVRINSVKRDVPLDFVWFQKSKLRHFGIDNFLIFCHHKNKIALYLEDHFLRIHSHIV